jgi:uncharacterized protein (DUF305 family)
MSRLVLIAAGLLVLAGCSSPAPPASSAPATNSNPGRYNDTDVMFLQMMVPHLDQGISIVRLARDRAARPEVRTLAAAIETTQADEATTMATRLRDWRQPPTAPAGSHLDHGGMPDTTAGEIATLTRIAGPDFDRRFLNTMIARQDDAIQLARMESATGTNPETKTLAARIDRSRSAQIEQMLAYLGQ